MRKILLISFSLLLSTLSAAEALISKDSLSININDDKYSNIEEEVLISIQSEDYAYLEKLLQSGIISSGMIVNGKPLIIHAAIHDKPEMILLLATYGAMLVDPIYEEGKDIMEYAKKYNAIHAQAQIIIIRA